MSHDSFTIEENGIVYELVTDIFISLPTKDQNALKTLQAYKCRGIWDTGATLSSITNKLAASLGLVASGTKEVYTAGGKFTKSAYEVNVYLPNNLAIPFVTVIECEELSVKPEENIEVLIGMDIISLGDFCVTNHNGKTCLSFRIPSLHKIDYNKHSNGVPTPTHTQHRNSVCKCGSGEKYKNCCGKI